MIGLIGAMTVEVELIKGSMTEKREETISGITFVQGKLEGVDCVAAVSGIGKVNAAMCAQTMILRYHPRLIINTGVAGGMGKGIKISDIVVADSVVQHDMDTSDLGDPKGFISGIDRIQIPCDEELNDKVRAAAGLMAEIEELVRQNADKLVKGGKKAKGSVTPVVAAPAPAAAEAPAKEQAVSVSEADLDIMVED